MEPDIIGIEVTNRLVVDLETLDKQIQAYISFFENRNKPMPLYSFYDKDEFGKNPKYLGNILELRYDANTKSYEADLAIHNKDLMAMMDVQNTYVNIELIFLKDDKSVFRVSHMELR